MGGSGQEKEAHPQPKSIDRQDSVDVGSPKPVETTEQRTEVYIRATRTALRAAQEHLDQTSNRVDAIDLAQQATPYLYEAAWSLERVQSFAERLAVSAQFRETDAAFSRAVYATRGSKLDESPLDALAKLVGVKRNKGISTSPNPSQRMNPNVDLSAVASMIEVVGAEAAECYSQLATPKGIADSDMRLTVVTKFVNTAKQRLVHVAALMNDHGQTIRDAVVASSSQVIRVRTWVSARPSNDETLRTLDQILPFLDQVRKPLGLPHVDSLPAQIASSEDIEAKNEHLDLAAAEKRLYNSIEVMMSGYSSGVHDFEVLSSLRKSPSPPPLFIELLKFALIAFGGNLIGAASASAIAKFAAAADKPLTEGIKSFIAGTASDTVQPIIPRLLPGDVVTSENQATREKLAFVDNAKFAHATMWKNFKDAVGAQVSKNRVTSAQLDHLAEVAASEELQAAISKKTYEHMSHEYAKHLARTSTVRKEEELPGGTESSMSDYLIQYGKTNGAQEAKEEHDPVGVGVLEVLVEKEKGLNIERFSINGLNSDMARAVAENARYELAALKLPLVVNFIGSRDGDAYARVAVDENLIVRDSWRSIKLDEAYDKWLDPIYLWDFVRGHSKNRIPQSAVKLSDVE